MPVSETEKATTGWSPRSVGELNRSFAASRISIRTSPAEVNFTALDSRLRSTCWSRCWSVTTARGTSGAMLTVKRRSFSAMRGRNVASTACSTTRVWPRS